MASDISYGTNLATLNMKPAANENIDALWGQNVGDFLGALRTKPIYNNSRHSYPLNGTEVGTYSNTAADKQVHFTSNPINWERWYGHNKLSATFYATDIRTCTSQYGGGNGLNIYGTILFKLCGNLGTFTSTPYTYSGVGVGLYRTYAFDYNGAAIATTIDMSSYVSPGSAFTLERHFYGSNYNGAIQNGIYWDTEAGFDLKTYWG